MDTWCALVATRAKKIPLGEKKVLYLCSAVMQQSSYEWKLMKNDAIPRGTLLKSKNFVQKYCRSVTGNDHTQKYDTKSRKCAPLHGRQKPKFTASQITSGVCPIEKIVKFGILDVFGISLNTTPLLWVATDFPLGMHHPLTKIKDLFLGAAVWMVLFRLRFRIGEKSSKKVFSRRLRL